jgi:hypothetical protein
MRFFRREDPGPPPAPAPSAHELRTQLVARYDALCHEVFVRGAHFPKDHGDWVRLVLPDGQFLELDSWGRHLTLKSGSGEYTPESVVLGFAGAKVERIGGHFGEPTIPVSVARIEQLMAHVLATADQNAESHPRLRRR